MIGKLSSRAIRLVSRGFAILGSAKLCYACNRRVGRFLPYRGGWKDVPPRIRALDVIGSDVENFSCPRCGAHDRERHLLMYFDRAGMWKRIAGAAVLHFAPERVLDEIRLLGPDVYEAACCRSLLRVFAADFARREGMVIDGERLHDTIAAFRNSRNLEQDGELARFLAGNDLSEEDLERLVAADEMVRWACEQAERGAFGGLLDDLRLSGEYPRLAARVRARLEDEGRPDAPDEQACGGEAP